MQEFDDINAFKRNFYEKYHKVLVPAIKNFENERKIKLFLAAFLTIILVTGGIAYFIFIITFKIEGRHVLDLGAYMLAGGIICYQSFKKNFEKKIKSKIMHVVSSCFGNMVWSQSYPSNKSKTFVKAGLFSPFTESTVDDSFSGSYKGVAIDIVEANYKHGSGRSKTTVFRGLCIKLDMNKNFRGHTVLMEDTIFHKSPLPNLRHTELEDVKFEKKYDVFTDDEVEARYILTPTFMEKLSGIKMAFRCNAVRCGFYQGKLLIAMKTTKDLFSIGSLVKPVTDTKQFQELCNQFISVLSLIDYLKLDKQAVL